MKKNTAITICLIALITGCAHVSPPQKIAEQNVSRVQGRTIAAPATPTPSFKESTAGKAAFGAIGAAYANSEGNLLIKTNGIVDPAVRISAELSQAMANVYGATIVPSSGEATDDSPDMLAKVAPSADFVLDVRTILWSLGYFPTDWTHYSVRYLVRARLIDQKTKQVVALSVCATPARPDSNDAPTYDMLVGNGAAGLKKTLATTTERCITQIKAEFKISEALPVAGS